jgi:hypothetical protein
MITESHPPDPIQPNIHLLRAMASRTADPTSALRLKRQASSASLDDEEEIEGKKQKTQPLLLLSGKSNDESTSLVLARRDTSTALTTTTTSPVDNELAVIESELAVIEADCAVAELGPGPGPGIWHAAKRRQDDDDEENKKGAEKRLRALPTITSAPPPTADELGYMEVDEDEGEKKKAPYAAGSNASKKGKGKEKDKPPQKPNPRTPKLNLSKHATPSTSKPHTNLSLPTRPKPSTSPLYPTPTTPNLQDPFPRASGTEDLIHPLSTFPPFTIPPPKTIAKPTASRTLYIISFCSLAPLNPTGRLHHTQSAIPPTAQFLYTLSCDSWTPPDYEIRKRDDGLRKRVQEDVMRDARAKMNVLAAVNDVMACFLRGHGEVSLLVGCQTGRWRSVAAVERIADAVQVFGARVVVRHAHL